MIMTKINASVKNSVIIIYLMIFYLNI
jgi:hypothetical protein